VEGAARVVVTSGKHAGELYVDSILVAVGRTPNLEGLDLEAAGVKYGSRGIEVNSRLQTSREHIFASGDVVGGMQFTHYAGYQAAQAVRNIFLPVKLKFNPRLVPWVTFTDPEVAHIGMTEVEAKHAGRECTVIRFPYSLLERAITDQDTVGLMKFLIDGKRRFIGCHIAGANAGELINEITLAMNNNLTVDHVIGSIHAYPTYSFGVPVAPPQGADGFYPSAVEASFCVPREVAHAVGAGSGRWSVGFGGPLFGRCVDGKPVRLDLPLGNTYGKRRGWVLNRATGHDGRRTWQQRTADTGIPRRGRTGRRSSLPFTTWFPKGS